MPALVESIKAAGLVLVSDISEDFTPSHGPGPDALRHTYRMPEGIDGFLRGNGILRFNDSVDM